MEEPKSPEELAKQVQDKNAGIINFYSQNRKSRRQFKKLFGIDMPARYHPYNKSNLNEKPKTR